MKWYALNICICSNKGSIYLFRSVLMSAFNLKFIHANVLRAAELKIPVKIMFSERLAQIIEAWEAFLRIDSPSCAIALFNIVATTLQFSSVSRSCDDCHQMPINLYNMVLARSCILYIRLYYLQSLFFRSLWKK